MPSPETLREGLQTLGVAGVLGVQILNRLRLRQLEKDIAELKKDIPELKEKAHCHEEEEVPTEEPVGELTGEGESPERKIPERQRIPEPAPA